MNNFSQSFKTSFSTVVATALRGAFNSGANVRRRIASFFKK